MQLFTRTKKGTVKKTLAIFKEQVAYEKKDFIKTFTFIPISDLLLLVIVPLLISFLIQSLITQPHNLEHALTLIGLMALAVAAGMFFNIKGYNAMFYHEERIISRLLKKASDEILQHSFQFFTKQKVGSLAGDINNFSRSYMIIVDSLAMHASRIAVDVIVSIIVIAFIAPVLLIPVLLLTVFVTIQTLASNSQRSVYRNQRKELQSKLVGSIADIFGNQTLVRMFAKRNYEVNRLYNERLKIERVTQKEIVVLQRHALFRYAGLYGMQLLLLALCAYLISHNMLSIAAVVFIVTYLSRFTNSAFSINGIIRSLEQGFLDAAKVTELLSIPQEVTDKKEAVALEVNGGEVTFNNVTFSYADAKNEHVFDDLNLKIPAGQRIGLVGKSGGGKTTLTSLLLRYMDINNGVINIDGQNIADVTQDSLRNSIAYVPQDPFLFHRTLRENIAYGQLDATDQQIIDAAEKAHAMEFINKLPNGINTVVGERGIKLSGGQRQRIAIARAFLKDSPILVLDEATSALDSESEHLIQQSLQELMSGRTSIVVAHRLSTIAKLDRIVVLNDGQIIEDGSHEELLNNDSLYATLWKRQSGGFIEE